MYQIFYKKRGIEYESKNLKSDNGRVLPPRRGVGGEPLAPKGGR
jgi:hypothetical protein